MILQNPVKDSEKEKLSIEVLDAMHKVSQFMGRGNAYATDGVVKLNNFVTAELVEGKATKCISAFVEDGKDQYRNFRKERFVEKPLKRSAILSLK